MHKTYTYPDHIIPNSRKDKKWIRDYIKAAWNEYKSTSPEMFYGKRERYNEIAQYAHGKQSISKYNQILNGEDDSGTDAVISKEVLAIVSKFRRIAINKLSKIGYNPKVTPIDSLAQKQKEGYFGEKFTKLLMAEQARKQGVKLPQKLLPKGDDPRSLEELKFQKEYVYNHQAGIEMEQAFSVVLNDNDYDEISDQIKADLWDFGVAGIKEYIDSNDAIKVRRVNPMNVICDRSERRDFKDARHAGEIIEMSIADLMQMAGEQFSIEQYKDIAESVAGKNGNPSHFRRSVIDNGTNPWKEFKIRVVDLEFFSMNYMEHEYRKAKNGNQIVKKLPDDYKNKRKKNKYKRTYYKVVYKGKWIEGTEFLFDYGLCTDMKRLQNRRMDTELSYHFYAPEFYDMQAASPMEQMIPIADSIQLAWNRLQQTIAEARPKGVAIEIGALEDVPLGKGGKKMSPKQLIDLYNKKGILVFRRENMAGQGDNFRPIEELNNGLGQEAANWFNLIQNHIGLLRDIVGMNEFTDGSGGNPRAVSDVAMLANESTNHSLYSIIRGDKRLFESLCEGLLLRILDLSKRKKLKGTYQESIGANSVKFFKTSPNLSTHEYAFRVEDKPDDVAKQRLQQKLDIAVNRDQIDVDAAVMIENMDNVKVAQQYLAFKIKEKRERDMQDAMARQQQNAELQTQSNIKSEQEKRKTLQLETDGDAYIEEVKGDIEKELEVLQAELDRQKVALEQKLYLTRDKAQKKDT